MKHMQMKKNWIYLLVTVFLLSSCQQTAKKENNETEVSDSNALQQTQAEEKIMPVDTAAFNSKVLAIANGDTTGLWPIANQPYPKDGAILPFKRIVAYYGNLYSKKMGILGELPPADMWKKLKSELAAWEKADPTTPVVPAIHYIAVVAQGHAMPDGKYCKRMPDEQIDSALAIAKMGNAIVFLDIQVGQSDVMHEVPLLEKYLKMPQVHLGIDPEFSMKEGHVPGRKIGTMNEVDINFCTQYLADLVKTHNLPPKVLVVHRFTQGMVRNHKSIKLHPEVQIVMNMDGWGEPILKRSTYKLYIYKEPVQFTGFKIFYKNDLKKAPHTLMTPEDLMKLKPQPIYIQYQ